MTKSAGNLHLHLLKKSLIEKNLIFRPVYKKGTI